MTEGGHAINKITDDDISFICNNCKIICKSTLLLLRFYQADSGDWIFSVNTDRVYIFIDFLCCIIHK
jgi:hypothetical protein